MEALLLRSIVPKLIYAMQSFVVNPANQVLDAFRWTLVWADLLPPQHLLSIFETQFFPKWFSILVTWLNNNPDLDEVTNWYVGECIANPDVFNPIHQARYCTCLRRSRSLPAHIAKKNMKRGEWGGGGSV